MRFFTGTLLGLAPLLVHCGKVKFTRPMVRPDPPAILQMEDLNAVADALSEVEVLTQLQAMPVQNLYRVGMRSSSSDESGFALAGVAYSSEAKMDCIKEKNWGSLVADGPHLQIPRAKVTLTSCLEEVMEAAASAVNGDAEKMQAPQGRGQVELELDLWCGETDFSLLAGMPTSSLFGGNEEIAKKLDEANKDKPGCVPVAGQTIAVRLAMAVDISIQGKTPSGEDSNRHWKAGYGVYGEKQTESCSIAVEENGAMSVGPCHTVQVFDSSNAANATRIVREMTTDKLVGTLGAATLTSGSIHLRVNNWSGDLDLSKEGSDTGSAKIFQMTTADGQKRNYEFDLATGAFRLAKQDQAATAEKVGE